MKTVLSILTIVLTVATASAQTGPNLSPSDYIEINHLYAKYAHYVDGSDPRLLSEVFTDDGEFIVGEQARRGSQQLKAMVSGPAKERPLAKHFTTNIIVTPSPDGARGTAYLLFANLQATPPAVTSGGIYDDVIVKTPGGWRFKRRVYTRQVVAPPSTEPNKR